MMKCKVGSYINAPVRSRHLRREWSANIACLTQSKPPRAVISTARQPKHMEDDIAPIRAYPKPLQLKASASLRFLRIIHSCVILSSSAKSQPYTLANQSKLRKFDDFSPTEANARNPTPKPMSAECQNFEIGTAVSYSSLLKDSERKEGAHGYRAS